MNGVFHLLNITSSFLSSFVFDVSNDNVSLVDHKLLRLPRYNNATFLKEFVNAFIEIEHKELKLDQVQVYLIPDPSLEFQADSELYTILKQILSSPISSLLQLDLDNKEQQLTKQGRLELNENQIKFDFFEIKKAGSLNLFHNELQFKLSELVISDDLDLAVVRKLWQDENKLIADMDKLVNFGLSSPLRIQDKTIRFSYYYIFQHIFKKLFEGFAQDKLLNENYQIIVSGLLGSQLGDVDFILQMITASAPFAGAYEIVLDEVYILPALAVLGKLTGLNINYSQFIKRYQVLSFDGPQKKHIDEDTLCKVVVNGDREVYPYENIIWGFEVDSLEEMHILIDMNKGVSLLNNKGSQVLIGKQNGFSGIVIDTTYKLPTTTEELKNWYNKVSDNFKL